MLTGDELEALRDEQNKWLPATGTISRPSTDDPSWDEYSDLYMPADATIVYDGPLRVMPMTRPPRIEEYGEDAVTVHGYIGTVPWDADPIEVGDIVTLTAADDPTLIGRPLIVTSVERSSFETARRLHLEDHLG